MEFGSVVLNGIAGFYSAPDEAALALRRDELKARFAQLEQVLAGRAAGPWFDGERFGLVDAVFGPVFRYFDVFERIGDFGIFDDTPRVSAWRRELSMRPSVRAAVADDYGARLLQFLRSRGGALSAQASRCPTSP